MSSGKFIFIETSLIFLLLQIETREAQVKCIECSCNECTFETDGYCYDPAKELEYRKKREEEVPGTIFCKEIQENGITTCLMVSYDENRNGSWYKHITRSGGYNFSDYMNCMDMKGKWDMYKNVICMWCCQPIYCNDVAIVPPTLCYFCSCNKCDPSIENDYNCLYPGPKTPLVPIEDDDTCILATWVTRRKYTHVTRTAGKDINKCFFKKDRRHPNFTKVFCKNCSTDRCNADIIHPVDLRTFNCYECRCEFCAAEENCVAPGKNTKLIESPAPDGWCVLYVYKRPDGTVGIVRSWNCDSEYCAERFQFLNFYTQVECTQCMTDKCNGANKTNFFGTNCRPNETLVDDVTSSSLTR